MTAPWNGPIRSTHSLLERVIDDWVRCRAADCDAIQVGDATHGRCYRHHTKDRKAALLAQVDAGRVDLRGTTFDETLLEEVLALIKNRDEFCVLDLQQCVFTGRADFSGHLFGYPEDPLRFVMDFGGARFEDVAVFTRSRFHAPVCFEDTTFTHADFGEAEFTEDAWFLGTRFDTGVFADATFAKLAAFHRVSATSGLAFTGATFAGAAHLEPLAAGDLDLTQTSFAERATVHFGGRCDATGARFADGVDMILLPVLAGTSVDASALNLTRVRFGAPSTVTGVQGGIEHTAEGLEVHYIATMGRHDQLPSLTSLMGTDVGALTVTDVDLSRCRFKGAINLDKLGMGGTTQFARPSHADLPRWGLFNRFPAKRDMLFEELIARNRALPYSGPVSQERLPEYDAGRTDDQLVVLYRALRKAREDAKDEPGAGDFYMGEMEARRRGTRRFAERLVLTAYDVLSGYGQRAGRAVAWLMVLVVVLTGLLLAIGLPDSSRPGQMVTGTVTPGQNGALQQIDLHLSSPASGLPADRVNPARVERAVRIAVGSVLFRDTDQQLTTAGRWTVNAGRLLGPILIALAALAIRARVKR